MANKILWRHPPLGLAVWQVSDYEVRIDRVYTLPDGKRLSGSVEIPMLGVIEIAQVLRKLVK